MLALPWMWMKWARDQFRRQNDTRRVANRVPTISGFGDKVSTRLVTPIETNRKYLRAGGEPIDLAKPVQRVARIFMGQGVKNRRAEIASQPHWIQPAGLLGLVNHSR
jgi:hypothetical protein